MEAGIGHGGWNLGWGNEESRLVDNCKLQLNKMVAKVDEVCALSTSQRILL